MRGQDTISVSEIIDRESFVNQETLTLEKKRKKDRIFLEGSFLDLTQATQMSIIHLGAFSPYTLVRPSNHWS